MSKRESSSRRRDKGSQSAHYRGDQRRPVVNKGNGSRRLAPMPTREAKKPSTNARVRLNVATTGAGSSHPTHPTCQKCLAANEKPIARQKCIKKMSKALPKDVFKNATPIELLVRSNGDKTRLSGKICIGGAPLETPCDAVGIIPFQQRSGKGSCREFGPLCPLVCHGITSPMATKEGRETDILSAVLGYPSETIDIIDLNHFGE